MKDDGRVMGIGYLLSRANFETEKGKKGGGGEGGGL